MQTLSNGVKKMEDGDRGSVFFDALALNQQKQNDHVHDGVTGEPIDSKDLTRATAAVTDSGWASSGTFFRKTITMPSGYLWGSCKVAFFLDSTGVEIFPRVEPINTTSFYLYMPVDNLAVDILYT